MFKDKDDIKLTDTKSTKLDAERSKREDFSLNRIKKISWDETLIKMYNPKFYDEYVKTGYLEKKIKYKNGVPLNWELENGFGDK